MSREDIKKSCAKPGADLSASGDKGKKGPKSKKGSTGKKGPTGSGGSVRTTAHLSSEEIFRVITESSSDAIILSDQKGRVTFWNKGAEEIFGYKEEEVLGKAVTALMPKRYREAHLAGLKRLREGGDGRIIGGNVELYGLRRDGTEFPLELTLSSCESCRSGEGLCFSAIIRDISDRVECDAAIGTLLSGVEGEVGGGYFDAMVKSLSGWLDAECVLVGRFKKDGTVKVLSMTLDGEMVSDFSYPLKSSPCERVSEKGFCIYPTGVSALFPSDDVLVEMGADGYVGTPLKAGDGTVVGIFCAISRGEMKLPRRAREVMEILAVRASVEIGRMETERLLEESESKFRAVFDNADDGILVADTETKRFIFANDMFCRMVGYTSAEVEGLGVVDIHPSESIPHVIDQFEKQARGEIRVSSDIPIMRKDGSVFYADVNSSFYEVGGKRCLLGIFRDVTERRESEELVRQTLAERDAIMNAATVGIAYLKGRRFIWLNRAMGDIFGYGSEELMEGTTEKLYPSTEEFAGFEGEYTEALRGGETFRGERMMRRSDGALFWCSMMGRAIDRAHYSKGSIWIIEDITERKESEGELVEAKEGAEEATRVKDKFVALVSHDLKGPITRILGYLELLRGGSVGKEAAGEFIDEALASCEDMSSLITEILDIGRIKSSGIEPLFIFVDAHHIAEYALKGLSRVAEKKGVKLINEASMGTRVYADEKLYFEAVRNLVSNAVKFCKAGDTVKVSVEEGEACRLSVVDTGAGIAEERLDALFKYEVKTSTPGTLGESGSGYGLPLARDIIEAQGGKLSVNSKVGVGSTFCVSLPHVRPRVLVVDDDRSIVKAIRLNLEKLEVDFFEANDGETALGMIEEDPPHLVLLDLRLPGLSGVELLDQLKKDPKTKRIPVIVLTGRSEAGMGERIFRWDADDFVSKPFRFDDLAARVKKFVC